MGVDVVPVLGVGVRRCFQEDEGPGRGMMGRMRVSGRVREWIRMGMRVTILCRRRSTGLSSLLAPWEAEDRKEA